jgi:2-octaprenyl-6-methoxyphenol hydroxylase
MSVPDPSDAADQVDVAIVGGGLVGASLAVALAPLGLKVALVESTAADAERQPSFDDRTTALGNGSRQVFESLGLWDTLAPQAAPIRRIHVSDAGRFGFARLEAPALDLDAFGFVLTNRVLGAALRERLAALPGLDLRMPARCTAVTLRSDCVELTTDPGERPLRARLAVAADGAGSSLRAAAGLEASTEDYRQVAIVAHVLASQPSDGTAYERFTPQGPFAVLPLAGGAWGVVWTLAPADAERMLALPDAEYLAELQRAFGWRAGRFLKVGARNAYPLKLVRAAAVTGARVALVGNAAQGLHPVAGQGFNLGLRDVATLAEILSDALRATPRVDGTDDAGTRVDVGAPAVLAQYAARRVSDRDGMVRFTDGLVKLFGDERPGVPWARDLGLLLFDLSPTAKRALSRLSWGFGGRTPRLARGAGPAADA